MKKIAFIAYYFSEEEGVGSARSRSLAKTLEKEKNLDLTYYNKTTWKTNNIIWTLLCFFSLLKNKYDMIYISCGPFFHLFFVTFVSKIKKNKLIVDLRDPWSINIKTGYGNPLKKVNMLKLFLSQFIEKFTYNNCFQFWVCTPGMKEEYKKLFKGAHKIRIVLNGFDVSREELEGYNNKLKLKDSEYITLVCLGKFAEYNEEKAEKILNKINEINGIKTIKLVFIGSNKEKNIDLIKKYKLEYQTIFYPKMPYELALRIACKGHIGICLVRNEKFEFGTKVYDYIGLELPILDCFDEESNFKKQFNEYLVDNVESFSCSFNNKDRFRRKNIFKDVLKYFLIRI